MALSFFAAIPPSSPLVVWPSLPRAISLLLVLKLEMQDFGLVYSEFVVRGPDRLTSYSTRSNAFGLVLAPPSLSPSIHYSGFPLSMNPGTMKTICFKATGIGW